MLLNIFLPFSFLLFFAQLHDACQDLMSACRHAHFVCWHPVVGHTVRKNCAQTCRQQCSGQQTKVDHPSCRTWTHRQFCKSRLAAEMSVYCPNACNHHSNPNKNTPKPTVPTTTTISPQSNNPKLPLWSHSLNESTNVCGSFYDYTCGQYQAEHRPTSKESFGRLTDHIKLVTERQQALIFDNFPTKSTAVQKMRQFRDKCMDEQGIERLRARHLIADIKNMGDLPLIAGQKWDANKFDLTQLLLKINEQSSQQLLFQLGVTEEKKSKKGGKASLLFAGADLLIKHPEDYLDASKKDMIKSLKYFLIDLVQILASDMRSQQTYAAISSAINDLVKFEQKIAEIYVDLQLASNQQLEDALTQRRKLSDLQRMADSIKWSDYFTKNALFSSPQLQRHLQSNPDVFVLTEDLTTRLNGLIKATDPKTLANYLIVRFIVSRTAYLDARFGDAARRFAQKLDGDVRPRVREDECLDSILVNFPLVVDYLYTQKYMDQKTQLGAQQLWSHLKQGASQLISQQQWLSAQSKQKAQQKLNAMQCTFGAVDEARDSNKLDNTMSQIKFEQNDGYLQIAEKLQCVSEQHKFEVLWSNVNGDLSAKRWREERLGSGQVNAFLVKRQNRMFLPTAILHEPLFDPNLSHSVNFGALGFVVAQVMMRGFDWKGSHFDAQGQKQSIWDKKTGKDFKKARECLHDKYGSHAEPLTGINVDAQRTMRNNLADAAAIRIVSETYKLVAATDKKVSGYEKYNGEQAMFISYGVTLCASLTKEVQTELLRTSPYSPNFFRVNIVLANYAEFQRVFQCGVGSRMIANPRCSAWQP